MPSPFPGMDPYLEGYLWPDVHHRLATQISDQLTPRLRPKYVARIEIQVVTDESPEGEVGIMYPDVEIVRTSTPPVQSGSHAGTALLELTPATASVPLLEFEVRVATVEIRDAAQNQLVTSIEILSPVNKREPGLSKYVEKRRRLRAAHVHLIEIDLLRRGQRVAIHPRLSSSLYRVSLIRAGASHADIWALGLQDALPAIPVPLRPPDDDILLNLEEAFSAIYDRAAYDLSIEYAAEPPPPALSQADSVWMAQRLSEFYE
ncbi:MAG: DUF4058 family protein [Caldilineaceae bacterium]